MNWLSSILNQQQILAILTATAIGIVFGGLWFWFFAKPYHDAVKDHREVSPAFSYFLTSLMSFMMAVVLWILFHILGPDTIKGPFTAAGLAALMWLGFAFPALLWHAISAIASYKVIAIEGGSQLIQAVLMAMTLRVMIW